jgi:uncharacterized protein (TIGR03085 family)
VTHFAQGERHQLAEVLLDVGPEAPTLCEGWKGADLAAHLVVRERRPVAALGIVFAPLAGHNERVQRAVRDGHSWEDLVATVRRGPPLLMRPAFVDEPMNAAEFFIHLEDVRRAQPEWVQRELPEAFERSLWSRARWIGRTLRRRLPVGMTLVAPGFGRSVVRETGPLVEVVGPPSELLLAVAGRQSASRATFEGEPGAVDRLRAAALGM